MTYQPYSKQCIEADDIQAVAEAMGSSHLTQGERTVAFEKQLAEYIGCRYVTVLNSATSALFAAYKAYGLGEGDEVITTPISFVATANMLLECGATPVFADIKYDGNIDERRIEEKITGKTKAVVSVDYAGNPADAAAIAKLCQKHGLHFISDASHALGSTVSGKKAGTLAESTIFSFHAIKPITTFEGGAVATDDPAVDEQVRLLRSHGIVKKRLWNSDMVRMGYNFRLSDVASALGSSQLKKLERFIARREAIAQYYEKRFENNPYFTTPKIPQGVRSARHLYPILLDRTLFCPKEDIFTQLQERGVGVQVHYKPIHTNSFYKQRFGEQDFPVAQEFYKAQLSIPCHQGMEISDAEQVADTLLEVLQNYKGRCRW